MTTFTLQDLNLPATAEQAVNKSYIYNATKEEWMEHGMKHGISAGAIEFVKQQMGEVLPNPDIPTIINTICTQLQLLATVISQPKAQPSTTPPEGDQPSLQETIALTLKQADWFKEMVYERAEDLVDDKDFAY